MQVGGRGLSGRAYIAGKEAGKAVADTGSERRRGLPRGVAREAEIQRARASVAIDLIGAKFASEGKVVAAFGPGQRISGNNRRSGEITLEGIAVEGYGLGIHVVRH